MDCSLISLLVYLFYFGLHLPHHKHAHLFLSIIFPCLAWRKFQARKPNFHLIKNQTRRIPSSPGRKTASALQREASKNITWLLEF